jgi:hypothetical protein
MYNKSTLIFIIKLKYEFRGHTIKQNYLNNKDLLKEIHLSKNSYCSFKNKEDNQYDVIVMSLNDINEETINEAKINKSTRIFKESGVKVKPESILTEELIFRVMTWQHIPLLPPKPIKLSKTSKKEVIDKFFDELIPEIAEDAIAEDIEYEEPINLLLTVKSDHIRLNFPPFFHYKIDEKGNFIIVGKSHWKGSLEDGEFCKIHGELTEKLACMLMKLAEKYALKGNWRNYSYREEMQGQAVLQLCQVALQFDESKSQNPFAFLTSVSHNSFLRILNIEKKNQQLRDKLLMENNMNPSYSQANKDSAMSYDGYE